MSETRWTAGPYRAYSGDDTNGWWVIHDSEGHEIGSTDGGFEFAEAHLFAAAPDLYEAVRKAEQLAQIASDWCLYDVEIDGGMVPTWQLLDEFTAALAKARGKS